MLSMDLLVWGTNFWIFVESSLTSIKIFSQTQYVRCDSLGSVLDWSVTSCDAGLFCNSQLISPVGVNPCVKITQDLANCATPTIANPFDATGFCQSQRIGRYAYSTGCKQYIYCYLSNGLIQAAYYKCPGVTLFDDTLGACIDDAAFTCPFWKIKLMLWFINFVHFHSWSGRCFCHWFSCKSWIEKHRVVQRLCLEGFKTRELEFLWVTGKIMKVQQNNLAFSPTQTLFIRDPFCEPTRRTCDSVILGRYTESLMKFLLWKRRTPFWQAIFSRHLIAEQIFVLIFFILTQQA